MCKQASRRSFHRHDTRRAIRLRPKGRADWISLYMVDWSAAGAGISGQIDQIETGPAEVVIENLNHESNIKLACNIVWREDGKLGLRFLGAPQNT